MKKILDPQTVTDSLNDILQADSIALAALIAYRVPANEALSNHPTVQVSQEGVGLLGIINGLVGVKENGWGYIAAEFDDDGKLVKFLLTDEKDKC